MYTVSQFEYIAVLVSVIAGLGIVHLLRGVARFFTARNIYKPYWVHLLWTWNVFHFIVFFWWFVWRWSVVVEWQLVLFLFILLYATCLYLMCAILYPSDHGKKVDFKTVYFENQQVFFLLWALTIVLDIIDTRWKMSYGLAGFGTTIIVLWTTLITGSLIAARVRSHIYHAFWGILFFTCMAYFEYLVFSVLRAD